jgi:glycolate oxidase iron-sulfur subunit
VLPGHSFSVSEFRRPPQASSAPTRFSHLKNLDYSVLQQCMHCGLCLPTCPTYDATRLERHSPRGRIALMRAIADGQLEATKTFGQEIYFCLGCLACMTACPAGVDYAELFEHARAEAESSGALDSPKRTFIRSVALHWLFRNPDRLKFAGRLLRWYQKSGLQKTVRASGILKLLPRRLQALEAMTPEIRPEFSDKLIPAVTPAIGTRRFRVALLTGCVQDLIYSDVNRDTVEVLARNGCEVVTPPRQSCCGSLFVHNGEWRRAQELARENIDQFRPEQFDAIITNAGGCGSHLKHFSRLLADDPVYRTRAGLWDKKVKDIHEWLVEIQFRIPNLESRVENTAPPQPHLAPRTSRVAPSVVTYHDSCHLCHGQKITSAPREVLRALPGFNLVELPESNWCCGSAGVYNLIEPEMANSLLQRKLAHIQSTGARIVATANPGCALQIVNGARQKDLDLRVVHPVTLLAEAYRKLS